jgi:predicted metal-dependent peptidase
MVTMFSKSVTQLTLTHVFFTALLYDLKRKEDPNMTACAATDGVTLFINPTLFEKFDTKEGKFTLAHELMHVILFHSMRRGARDPHTWNVACDHASNLLLKEHGFEPYPYDLCDPQYKGMSAEQIYDLLVKDPNYTPGQGGTGEGENGKSPRSGDVVDYKPSENGNVSTAAAERQVGISLEKALQAAKVAGQLTKEQRNALREAQIESEPWYSHLRRYITVINAREYNWSRVDQRRMSYTGMITPEMRTERMGKLVVSIDESGSLDDRQLSAISAHVSDICKSCNPKELVVIRHTDRVTDVETYTAPEYAMELVRKSTGGTDFRPVFDYIINEHNDAQVTLMFTDMYGPMPDSFAGDCLWITSSQGMTAPFGELIHADFND